MIKFHFFNKYKFIAITLLLLNSGCEHHMKEVNEVTVLRDLAIEYLVDALKVYDIFDKNNEKIKFVRHSRAADGGYVVPEIALIKADVFLGYGVADDISFEELFAEKYHKSSYGFDCGVKNVKISNNKCKFINECISSDKYLYENQTSSHSIATFS